MHASVQDLRRAAHCLAHMHMQSLVLTSAVRLKPFEHNHRMVSDGIVMLHFKEPWQWAERSALVCMHALACEV